jgi:hypothetical protein
MEPVVGYAPSQNRIAIRYRPVFAREKKNKMPTNVFKCEFCRGERFTETITIPLQQRTASFDGVPMDSNLEPMVIARAYRCVDCGIEYAISQRGTITMLMKDRVET